MKNVVLFIGLLLAYTTYSQSRQLASVTDSTKKAFIVAIANYPLRGGWEWQNPLSSQNDLTLLRDVLGKQGFDPANLTVVSEAQATKAGVKTAFEAFCKGIFPGDKIIFHFSGHGQQIFDYSGDEPDQLDEALVLYDAPAVGDSAYHGEKHLLDDELNLMLRNLRIRVGPTGHVLAFVDACHSGTASRGQGKVRGGLPPIVPAGVQVAEGTPFAIVSGIYDVADLPDSADRLGKLVVFGGTASSEPNYEITDAATKTSYGSLTYGMAHAFASLTASTTYRQFHAQILNIVNSRHPGQTPMAEGNIDHVFFAGEVVEQAPYFRLASLEGDYVTLEGGTLHALQLQSRIALYPAGTRKIPNTAPLAQGTVVSAMPLAARVKLDKPLSDETQISSLWAFVTEYSYQDLSLNLMPQDIPEKQLAAIKSQLGPLPHLCWTTDPATADLILKQDATTHQMTLTDPATTLSFGCAFAPEGLTSRLETFTKVKVLMGFMSYDTLLAVGIQITPKQPDQACAYIPETEAQNVLKNIAVGEQVCVSAKNLSKENLYITIVEFWADGTLHQVYPQPNRIYDPLAPTLTFSYGGKVTQSDEEPYGPHIVKVFATTGKQLDFTSLEQAQWRGPSQWMHPLEQLLYNSRGVTVQSEGNARIFTQTLVYNLTPRL